MKFKKYRCVVCDHVYDPAVGDPATGIAPGTPFEQIPDSWRWWHLGAPALSTQTQLPRFWAAGQL